MISLITGAATADHVESASTAPSRANEFRERDERTEKSETTILERSKLISAKDG
jgi:hypothetical protein